MTTTVISLSMDSKLLARLDELVSRLAYSSRSEAIRDAVRRLLEEYELPGLRGREVLAAIAVVYEYGEGHADRRLARIRHEYNDIVIGNLHLHVNSRYCSELLVARGRAERILRLIAVIRGIRGTTSSRYLLVPLDEQLP